MTRFFLMAQLATAGAFIGFDPSFSFYVHDIPFATHPQSNSATHSPSWRCNAERCSITYPVSHLTAESIRLTLDEGLGKTITISGERAFPGCSCQSQDDATITLPFTPRPEDIESTLESERLLIILHKHASQPQSVQLSINKPDLEKEAVKKLHFVPHPSASTQDKVKETAKMREALDKFRAVAALKQAEPAPVESSTTESDTPTANETSPGL